MAEENKRSSKRAGESTGKRRQQVSKAKMEKKIFALR